MSFSSELLSKIQNTPVLTRADNVRFHRLSEEVFALELNGECVLLSLDAGIDLSYRLAEYTSSMEQR